MTSVPPEPLSCRLPTEARNLYPICRAWAWGRVSWETHMPLWATGQNVARSTDWAKGRPGAMGHCAEAGGHSCHCLPEVGAQAEAGGPNPNCRWGEVRENMLPVHLHLPHGSSLPGFGDRNESQDGPLGQLTSCPPATARLGAAELPSPSRLALSCGGGWEKNWRMAGTLGGGACKIGKEHEGPRPPGGGQV